MRSTVTTLTNNLASAQMNVCRLLSNLTRPTGRHLVRATTPAFDSADPLGAIECQRVDRSRAVEPTAESVGDVGVPANQFQIGEFGAGFTERQVNGEEVVK